MKRTIEQRVRAVSDLNSRTPSSRFIRKQQKPDDLIEVDSTLSVPAPIRCRPASRRFGWRPYTVTVRIIAARS